VQAAGGRAAPAGGRCSAPSRLKDPLSLSPRDYASLGHFGTVWSHLDPDSYSVASFHQTDTEYSVRFGYTYNNTIIQYTILLCSRYLSCSVGIDLCPQIRPYFHCPKKLNPSRSIAPFSLTLHESSSASYQEIIANEHNTSDPTEWQAKDS
jgi:hypothetical protein